MSPDDVLRFWFEEIEPRMWWVANPDFDHLIQQPDALHAQ
jgi:hypothetical protein